jgi:hypothetical protein
MLSNQQYRALSPNERVHMAMSAEARGDKGELNKIWATTKRVSLIGPDPAVVRRFDRLCHISTVLHVMLDVPIQHAWEAQRLLAPSSEWPEELEELGFDPPPFFEQFMNLSTNLVEIDEGAFLWDLEGPLSQRTRDYVESVKDAARLAVEAMLLGQMIGQYRRARAIVEGARHWCEEVEVSSDEFLSFSSDWALDQLNQLVPLVEAANDRLRTLRPSVNDQAVAPDPEEIDPEEIQVIKGWLLEVVPSLEVSAGGTNHG